MSEWVSEWVYFAITRNSIILSAVYNYNMLLPGIKQAKGKNSWLN